MTKNKIELIHEEKTDEERNEAIRYERLILDIRWIKVEKSFYGNNFVGGTNKRIEETNNECWDTNLTF